MAHKSDILTGSEEGTNKSKIFQFVLCVDLCVLGVRLPVVAFIDCLFPSGKMCLYCNLKR